MKKIAVIGGGAAGYFAAIHASQVKAEVILFEKTSNTLSKVKISGGGRCNVTHAAYEISKLTKNYPRGEKFLKKVFQHFNVKDTIDWFEKRGVKLKVESDGRMFPETDKSQTIIDILKLEAEQSKVTLKTNHKISDIKRTDKGLELLSNGVWEVFNSVIITTGGHPKLEGFDMIKGLGHTIVSPVPSLFTFNTPQETLKSLPGIAVPNALIKLEGTKLNYRGPLLITHWGVSGPAVLKLSAFGAKWLAEKHYKAKAHIQWSSEHSEEDLRKEIDRFKNIHPKKKIIANPLFNLPARLWDHFCELSGISSLLLWHECGKKQINKLIECLFNYIISIDGKTTFKEEFVTAGGVNLSEIDPQSMESKIVPGVFFAGEVVDVDGITGGFNFQAAWSTGYLAGKSAIKEYI
ncbi:BaiN/RdsA family NAD(P)/FAD-dependent oxidoreductase [Anditalea andensis]|uniref:Flavoprotein n=1 Tax=Anditalea andensis TaxID=1048983 RepID=A0A074KTZ4_9BACT|nr:NAD(P)/FAD-dependent oxidoreductase [Anditalea andensis]KEO71725.1 flavoprotein [Anditalea andensis]